jgi:hypothetical protein
MPPTTWRPSSRRWRSAASRRLSSATRISSICRPTPLGSSGLERQSPSCQPTSSRTLTRKAGSMPICSRSGSVPRGRARM